MQINWFQVACNADKDDKLSKTNLMLMGSIICSSIDAILLKNDRNGELIKDYNVLKGGILSTRN